MNKRSLIVLWTIIICGSTILIANKIISPNITVQQTQKTVEQQGNQSKELIETSTPIPRTNDLSALDSRSFDEYLKEGDRFLSENYYKSAIDMYKKALSSNPNSTTGLKKLAQAYIKDNNPILAEEVFKRALNINPNEQELKLGLAISLFHQNKIEEAKNRFWELPKEYHLARYYQGISLVIYKNYTDSQKIFDELIKRQNLPRDLKEKVQVLIDTEKSINLYAKDDELFKRLKYLYALTKVGEYGPTIPQLLALINEKNNYRDAWIVLGYAYLNSGKINEAIDSFLQAREIDANKAETMFYLGITYYLNNELEKSIFYLQRAQSLNFKPENLLEIKLAEVYKAKGDFQRSIERYESLYQKGEKSIFVFENIINIYLENIKDTRKAFEYAKDMHLLYPETSTTNLLLAKIYIETNNINYAKDFIQKALSQNPSNPETYYLMGVVSEIENKLSMAKQHYLTAYSLGMQQEVAKKALDKLNKINSSINKNHYLINISQP